VLRLFASAALALLFAGIPADALGQSVTGSIFGSVVDQSKQAVPGAAITLLNERTSDTRAIVSDDRGDFLFASVQPGLYTVKVELAGFAPYQRAHVVLSANDQLSLGTIELRAGAVTEAVTVNASGTPVQTRSAERSALITARQLEMMPVLGRDVQTVLRTLPGVRFDTSGDDAYNYLPGINGQGGGAATFAIDGLGGNDLGGPDFLTGPPNFDAVAEVKVLINSYQAEYGRSAGAMINVVTKSGTKEYRGSGYWYKRHEMWNATPFFNNALDLEKPRYRYSTLGANLGGPVPLKAFRDDMFFFYAYEHLRIRDPQPVRRVSMPTALERQGDFSQSFDQAGNLIVVRDPSTGLPFPGNRIPAERLNANGRALLDFFPQPNRTDRAQTNGEYNYLFQESIDRPRNRHDGRVDHRLSDRDSYYVRFGWSKQDHQGFAVPAGSSNWGLVAQHYLQVDRTVTGTYTRLIGSNTVNEASIGVRYNTEDGSPLSDEGVRRISRDTVGFRVPQFYPQNNPLDVIPLLTFGGGVVPNVVSVNYESRFPLNGADTWLTFNNVLTTTRGAHTLKAGLYAEWVHNIEGRRGTFPGSFSFNRDVNNPLDSNHPFANALLGNFTSYSESTTRNGGDGTNGMIQWFAQDTWRATRRLTVDYGLRFATYSYWNQRVESAAFALDRYDPSRAPRLYVPRLVANRRSAVDPLTGDVRPAVFIGAFVPGSGDIANGMVLDSDTSYPKGFREPPGLLVQPRFGVSFDPLGDGRTAVRAAAGVFHEVVLGSVSSWETVTNPPAQFTPTIFYEQIDRLPLLADTGTVRPTSVFGWERDGKTPVLYNFSAGVQRDIGFGTVVDIAYVGARGRHQERNQQVNTVPYGARFLPENRDPTTGGVLAADFYRPFQGYANVRLTRNVGYARYDSLQLAVNRRFAQRIQFGLAYTWSRARNIGGDIPLYQPMREWTYAPTNDHQPHVLVINYTWDIPGATRWWNNAVVRAVLDGWQLAGVTAFASGYPFTPSFTTTDGQDIWGGGDGGWIGRTGDPNLPRGDREFERWFDTSVFERPTAAGFGTPSRNAIQGPGFQNWDLSLFKNIPLGGRRQLQFRVEAYNAFNHTQWSNINTAASFNPAGQQINANFGRVTDTRPPRRLQMGLRLNF
jgi:hypothetical protein